MPAWSVAPLVFWLSRRKHPDRFIQSGCFAVEYFFNTSKTGMTERSNSIRLSAAIFFFKHSFFICRFWAESGLLTL